MSYAPWCPACKALQSSWEEFSGWSKDLNIKVGQVDVTASPGLSGRFMVTALPTIFHVLNGEFRQYRGARDKESFISFIEEDKWKSVDAIPGWKSPASFQMSVVSYFFKMSQLLRAVHTRLMEDYGLPTWGSYLIFAVATIIIGALLGLRNGAISAHHVPTPLLVDAGLSVTCSPPLLLLICSRDGSEKMPNSKSGEHLSQKFNINSYREVKTGEVIEARTVEDGYKSFITTLTLNLDITSPMKTARPKRNKKSKHFVDEKALRLKNEDLRSQKDYEKTDNTNEKKKVAAQWKKRYNHRQKTLKHAAGYKQ
ncbi:Thioredoxin- transmembrane protein 1 [Homalodisca vitripennis]|nr:Thioredoxin- transmembrane protein 1 [Homalodisca vitripennis]